MINEAEAKRLVDTYADMILRISLSYLKQKTDAEDICQTVLLKRLIVDKDFESEVHEKAWIIRTTINVCKDHLKSAYRRRTVSLTESTKEDQISATSTGSPEHELEEFIDRLPRLQALSIYLYYYEGYSIKEIASLLKKSEAAVSAYLSRGRRLLRKMLTDQGDGKEVAYEK